MSFSEGLLFVYREAWAFLRRAWWIAALLATMDVVVLIPEFDRYFLTDDRTYLTIYWNIANHLLISVVFYFFSRFVVLNHDLNLALQFHSNNLRTYLPFAIVFVSTGVMFELAFTAGWRLPAALSYFIAICLIALWAVSAPGGGTIITPKESIRRAFLRLPWAFALAIVVSLPFLVLEMILEPADYDLRNASWAQWTHYALNLAMVCAEQIVNFAFIHAFARHLGLKTEVQQLAPSGA